MSNKKELSETTIGLMTGVALFFDALAAIFNLIGLWWLVYIFYLLTFWLWFKINGLNFLSLRRAPTLGISTIIELIPGLNIVPTMTYTVLRIALDSKVKSKISGVLSAQDEDKERQKAA